MSALQDDRILNVGSLVSVWLGDRVARWWAYISECLSMGWNAEMGGWHWLAFV